MCDLPCGQLRGLLPAPAVGATRSPGSPWKGIQTFARWPRPAFDGHGAGLCLSRASAPTPPRRPECQAWTTTLLLGTCLLYCARVSMPVCAVSMSQDFGWDKKEAGVALSSFFWGYCLTQVAGGHLGDR